MTRRIYVFASNVQGRHGKGTARIALLHHGAIYGQGEGLQGSSYAIPTRTFINGRITTLPIDDIAAAVGRFREFACQHMEWKFGLVPIGCGNAGYTPEQMAPLFRWMPTNVIHPPEFLEVLHRLRDHYDPMTPRT